jgi:ribokinase
MKKAIIIVGSLNIDFVARVQQLPVQGETVGGWGFQMSPGGKGANQAFAIGRLGGQARMVGRLGEDIFAEQVRASLRTANVDTTHVHSTPGQSTGVALILVESAGQNQIVVVPGANACLTPNDLEAAFTKLHGDYLLMQLESPLETVAAAARLARTCGMITILDPAPAQVLSHTLLADIDLLTPNESEALLLLGRQGGQISLDEAPEVARRIVELGPKRVILKMGDKGAWLCDAGKPKYFPAKSVKPVDVTAAGDTFNGALAVALAEGKSIDEAICFANCAAAISVTRSGAQRSIPSRVEVEVLLAQQPQVIPT